jgi:transcriptional regulator with XRE-family HTH domain
MKKEFIKKEVNPFNITPQEEKEIEENRIKDIRRERFCEWAEIIKKEKNINDKQLAELFPITPQYLSNLKSGKKSVSNNIIERMIELTRHGTWRYSFEYLSGASDIQGNYEKEIRIPQAKNEKRKNLLKALYEYCDITINESELNELYNVFSDNSTLKILHLYDLNTGEFEGRISAFDTTRINHTLDIIADIFKHYM